LINVLRGSNNAEVHAGGYFQLKTYGVGKDVSFNDWRDYIIQLANQGLIEIMYSERSALKISPVGWKVLRGELSVKLTFPTNAEAQNGKKSKVPKIAEEGEVNMDLFAELKKLRYSISQEEKMPAYIIFSDKTLKAMASELPVTENAFLAISGVGMNKMEKYGEEFMEVIRKFKSAGKPKKVPTIIETLALYKAGLNPKEIAAKRGLQITTIYSHLSQLYTEGKGVELEKLVSKETINKVGLAFNDLNRKTELKPIFEKLNEAVSYGEIRMSLAILLRED